jgi:hypothetical protein
VTAYSYSLAQLIADVRFELKDSSPPPPGEVLEFTDLQITDAIKAAVRIAEPVGKQVVYEFGAAAYNSATHPGNMILHIKRLQSRSAANRLPIEIPPATYDLQRNNAAWLKLHLPFPPTSQETLIATVYERFDPTIASGFVDVDPEMLLYFACATLKHRQTEDGQNSDVAQEGQQSMEYRALAEQRKAVLLTQQYPPPPEPRKGRR